ncbi:MFS transporter [Caenibius sp. WL]|uniref:MFS transporter n=1 Tax=Caenibius sp. WL TaxID=2872646 RepID=UPI001C9928A7|nr:MFS transporter [Caenibius sp. WL]QZP08461.1 MFS transporter [Caenibius sp. WL]
MNAVSAPRALPGFAFAALFATTLATGTGNMGLISVMPAAGRVLGISDYLIASIFSLSALMWAITSPLWAARSDRKGRKQHILIGVGGFIVSMLGCGAVVLAGLQGLTAAFATFVGFLLVRSTYGMFGSASAAAAQAYVAERTEGQQRVRAIAGLGGALSLGTILGPAVAPFLILPYLGLSGPMFVFALAGVAIFIAVAIGLPSDRSRGEAVATVGSSGGWAIWSNRAVRPYLIYGLAMSCAQAGNTYTLGFLVIDRMGLPPAEAQSAIGIVMVAGAVAGLIAQWGLVGLCGMMPRALLLWGSLLAFLGNVLIIVLPGFTMLAGSFALLSFGYGLARPGYTAGASLAVGESGQGGVAGAVSAIAGASIVAVPTLAVGLYEWQPALPFLAFGAVMCGLLAMSAFHPGLSGKRTEAAIVSCER